MLSDALDTPTGLLCRFYTWLDERRYEDMVGLLQADATWKRQGKLLSGPDEVLQALRARAPGRQIRHVITNAFSDALSAERCVVTAYQTVYEINGAPGPTLASKISVVTAELSRHGAAPWRIQTLSSVLGLDLRST